MIVMGSNSHELKAVLFDLDGTLIHSVDHIVDCWQHTARTCLGREMTREEILPTLGRTLYDALLTRALRLAQSTLGDMPQPRAFHVEGAASLLDGTASEPVSLATLRALFEMMEEKERLVYLLDQYIDGPGLTVVIGTEHASPDLRPFSLVASTTVDNGTVRTVGVIGPTRMHYSRAIALVDGATQAVSRALRNDNQSH